MILRLKRGLELLLLGVLRGIPARLMNHVMFLLRNSPRLTDRWGYHVRAIHYYEPLPDFRQLTVEELGKLRLSPAVNFREEAQLALIERLARAYCSEVKELAATAPPRGFDFANTYFAGLDAAVYYALIRELAPQRVVEVGSGFSTQIAARALARNAEQGPSGRLLCIEPYPEARLLESSAKFEMLKSIVQDVPLPFFEQLEANDILMIDSSHVAKTGSDVCFELLDVLPRLKPGVWVHVHDIFLPSDYPAEWVLGQRWAFNEQYMLEAFLSFNSAFSVQLANAWLWSKHRAPVAQLYAGIVDGTLPASFWMRREN